MDRWERGFDYYVIREGDRDKLAELTLHELSAGSKNSPILAVPAGEGNPPPEGIRH